jgi:hypothetical protein
VRRADPEGEGVECGPPAGLPAVLAVNAVIAALLGAGFLWAALSEQGGAALYVACGLAGVGFGAWLAWMSHRESQARLVADRDGIALGTRGRARYEWMEIERFEVGTLHDHGEAVPGHCGVMVLRGGERIALRALRTDAPFRGCEREEIRERVQTLNDLHRARCREATVLESRPRC